MPSPSTPPANNKIPGRILAVSWVLMAGALVLTLKAGLLGALLAGLAIYSITHSLARLLPQRMDSLLARQMALAAVAALIVGLLTAGSVWLAGFLGGQGSGPGIGALMVRMADILVELKQTLPAWMTGNLPSSVHHFNNWAANLLKSHAESVQAAGQDLIRGLTRVVIGMVIGGLAAITHLRKREYQGPLGSALQARAGKFAEIFGQVVSAQVRISLLNTCFTAIFLMGILPLMGHPLPFTKTMILITFVAGLVPVIGNLVSNTVITVIALSVSLWVAIAALVFLVAIHKLEYFLNARIIGGRIQAGAWELLAAMLVMEACFGIAGVIAAPIYYAYLKAELRARQLI